MFGSNNVPLILSGNGGSSKVTMNLLWTNSSPTSAFAAQTVSLDLSSYSLIAIEFLMAYNATVYSFDLFLVSGNMYRISRSQVTTTNNAIRNITPSTTGVAFTEGYLGTATNNQYMIPYRIYGIK